MNFLITIQYSNNYDWKIFINGDYIQRVSTEEIAIDIYINLKRALDTGDNDIELEVKK